MGMKFFRSLVVLTFSWLAVPGLHAQTKKLSTVEAKDHIGDRATVCGKVVSTHCARSSKGEPTFLNLDEPYPKEGLWPFLEQVLPTEFPTEFPLDKSRVREQILAQEIGAQ
jgi:hypothetical protein